MKRIGSLLYCVVAEHISYGLITKVSVPPLSVSRYKVAITKQKDSEQTSSSLYNQNNIWTPAVDFSKYIEDNESIENEVC